MNKVILAGVAAAVAVLMSAGDALAGYKVWYKSNDRRWDSRIGVWIRYNSLNDSGVNPNNKAWYEQAAARLNQNYRGQGYDVTFAVGTDTTPPGGGTAPPPATVLYYFADVSYTYYGRPYRGYLGGYRSYNEAYTAYQNWARGVRFPYGRPQLNRIYTERR